MTRRWWVQYSCLGYILSRSWRWVNLFGLNSSRIYGPCFWLAFGQFLKNLADQCYGINGNFANFYPHVGMGSQEIFRGPAKGY